MKQVISIAKCVVKLSTVNDGATFVSFVRFYQIQFIETMERRYLHTLL